MKVCFASNNAHKLKEVRALLPGHELISLREAGIKGDLAEEQNTIEGNSAQKARYVFEQCGVSCFADDTGLEIEALQGAPGVYSARYAGASATDENNVTLVLKQLEQAANRRARFRTVITLITPAEFQQFEGLLHGRIERQPRGGNGFGYDPIFIPDGFDKTLAEMNAGEKNKISHRSLAIDKMIRWIQRQT